MLKYTITDVIGQKATIKFSEVTVITRTNFPSSKNNSAKDSFPIEIVYLNSRRTRLVCKGEEYDRLQEAYDKYEKWLMENPTFEKTRIDLSMLDHILQSTIVSSSESVLKVNDEIQKNLVTVNEKMNKNIVESDKNFTNRVESRMDEISEQIVQMEGVMKTMIRAADILNAFVPNDADKYKTDIEKKEIREDVTEE
tara:strand:+ start:113729 stop:114316 length:588 start_codon:yes stop_codon:yes gene_type:complete